MRTELFAVTQGRYGNTVGKTSLGYVDVGWYDDCGLLLASSVTHEGLIYVRADVIMPVAGTS